MNDIKGIYSALVTPIGPDGGMNVEALKRLVRHELESGVEGFYCCGSSGEGLLLERTDRKKIAEVAATETAGQVPVIVHTGSLSTEAVIDLSVHAEKCKAAAVSLIPPIYYNYSPAEIFDHYRAVMDAVNVGVIVYNIPQFTGISFTKKGSSSLLDDPRIIGIKHTSMNLYDLERIHDAYPDKILFNGFDEIYLYSMIAGTNATIGTTVNICPKLFKAIRKSAQEGRMAEAKALQSKLNAFVEALVEVSIFPATKYALTTLGIDCGPCKKPFVTLDDKKKKAVQKALENIREFL